MNPGMSYFGGFPVSLSVIAHLAAPSPLSVLADEIRRSIIIGYTLFCTHSGRMNACQHWCSCMHQRKGKKKKLREALQIG